MEKRLGAALLSLLLLAGCGLREEAEPDCTAAVEQAQQEGYETGYETGWEAGYAQGLLEAEPAEPEEPELPPGREGFVSVSEVVPEVLLEIRYYSTYNFVGDRIDGYQEPIALLTREAAEALGAVGDDLRDRGWGLKLYDAYRPQSAVDHFKAWSQDLEDQRMKAFFYPEVDKAELYDRGYIASRSGHSRGSTVDLTLFDLTTGKEADMGGTFDWFGSRSHADYVGDLTETQRANRALLRETMEAHGFRGISTEWWHFTLRDEPYPDTYFTFPVSD